MQEQLSNVQHIQATDGAFVAILECGAAVIENAAETAARCKSSSGTFSSSKQLLALLLPFGCRDLGAQGRRQQLGARAAQERPADPTLGLLLPFLNLGLL